MASLPIHRRVGDPGRREFLRRLAGFSAFAVVAGASAGVVDGKLALAQAPDASCQPRPPQPPMRLVAPARLAADLPAPFGYMPRIADSQTLLRDVAAVVASQAAGFSLPACFLERPYATAERVDFLSPFEYLVLSVFDQEPERRDALLDRYADDPRAAIRELGDGFPSPKGELSLTSFAYYDLDADRIRVNAAALPTSEAQRVLVHELWHAMPDRRRWRGPDSRAYRENGFWVQQQGAGRRAWIPVEQHPGLPYPHYLLDEGMAVLMELRFAGPSRYHRPDVLDAQRLLDHLMRLAGPSDVVRLFLSSDAAGLAELIGANRSRLPELPAG